MEIQNKNLLSYINSKKKVTPVKAYIKCDADLKDVPPDLEIFSF